MQHGGHDDKTGQIARGVLDSLLEGCQVISPDFRYLYVNDAVLTQGQRTREQLLGRTMTECYPGIQHTEVYGLIARCLKDRQPSRLVNEFTYPDGTRGWFELRILPVPEGACVLSLDISESRRAAATLEQAREQQRQTQKMEAVGRLASAIAHDFNNLLSVVMGHASVLAARVPSVLAEDAEEIIAAAERGAALTRQLLTFARIKPVALSTIDPAAVLHGVEGMLRRLLGAHITLIVSTSPDIASIECDVGLLEQAIMNLIVNARDAMPRGGQVTVQLSNVEIDAKTAALHPGIAPGPFVEFTVRDTGVGMSTETRQRIFEPFFTTKEVGRGTGLGLATVFGIMQQVKGSISVESELGRGSTFTMLFPKSTGTPARAASRAAAPLLSGNETVLVVEDDQSLRAVVSGILSSAGYQVLEASDGEEAIALANVHRGPIQLLVADVSIPGPRGHALVETLHQRHSMMKTLFMSGLSEEALSQQELAPGAVLLEKPFRPSSLLARARGVIDGTSLTPIKD